MVRGVVDFRRAPHEPRPRATRRPDEAQAARLAALLDLTDGSGFALLLGGWSVHAPLVRAVAETPLVIVDPPDGMEGAPGISGIRCDGVLPLAAGVARGVVLDGGSPARVASAVRATRHGRAVRRARAPCRCPKASPSWRATTRCGWGSAPRRRSPLLTLHVRRGR